MRLKEIQSIPVKLEDVRAAVRQTQRDHAGTIEAFHRLWHGAGFTWGMTSYCGVATLKNPLDLWVAGEIIHQTKPTLIIETGTAYGGSALAYAHALDHVGGEGFVVTIDQDATPLPTRHPRIRWVRGRSSTDPELVASITALAIDSRARVMVFLDADHRGAHVAAELAAYAPLVTEGCFLVVEDTNMNGHPMPWDNGDGPAEGLAAWRESDPVQAARFQVDPLAERYLLTMYPGGWLRCYNPGHASGPQTVGG